MTPRMQELIDRIQTHSGPISDALSASEWHELQEAAGMQSGAPKRKNGPVKPGWRSSEFWLTLAAVVLPAVHAAGLFGETSPVTKVIAIGIAALAAFGYNANRTALKRKQQ